MQTIPRRQFLQTTGYLSIGFSLFGCNPSDPTAPIQVKESFVLDPPASPLPSEQQVDAWLRIHDNGQVQILTGRMELGQGIKVVMQQVAGEELNIVPEKIVVVLADTGRTPNEGYTAGSRGVESGAMSVRRAAAAARQKLLELAAAKWDLSLDQLELSDGMIAQKGNPVSINIGELLEGKQLTTEIPENVQLKPKDQYQWVGQPIPHPDMEKIVRGEALYVQDLRFPEMVHARVLRPPVYGANLVDWDRSVEQMPGVLKVVQNGSFLAVVAEEEYEAVKAVEAMREKVSWKGVTNFPKIVSWTSFMVAQTGDQFQTDQNGHTHHSIYSKPYLMHGSIGPSCAVAVFAEGRLHLWAHTQGVYPLRSTISHMTGLPEDAIRITGVRGSGCYGHNGADDVAADAALVAMVFPGRPVRLQWQRRDEHQWEPYGSAMRMELSAKLDNKGIIQQWTYHLWSDGHSTRPRGDAANLMPARYLQNAFAFDGSNRVGGGTRNAEPYYTISKITVQDHYVKGPLRTSALRSLGAYANIFAIECFMDELAERANRLPLDFRMLHSSDSRAIAVMERLKQALQNEETEEGEGIGIAFSRYKNTASYCAVGAKVWVDLQNKIVKPLKMWAVLDAGEAINPDGLKNQTEGGMIQAVSWTLKEEVQFNDQEITSKDWGNYPILRFDSIPETEVIIIDRPDEPPLGAGEAAQGPAGAAIANAVYQACGKRIRELPLEKGLI